MQLYKLDFDSLHIGKTRLSQAQCYIHADTLFSALCLEALSQNRLSDWLAEVHAQDIRLSDAMPYIDSTFYIPKPICTVHPVVEGDSTQKKQFKNLSYISINDLDPYLTGEFDLNKCAVSFGEASLEQKVNLSAVDTGGDSEPYQVGLFRFNKQAGLYLLVNGHNPLLEELLISLQYTGLGGKRSAGYGKFILEKVTDVPPRFSQQTGTGYLCLSTCLPTQSELEQALVGASYSLLKRSGFVSSATYAPELVRKKDLYTFAAGSVFLNAFEGDIYDVSDQGTHPVYRYAKSLFIRGDFHHD